MTVTRFVGGPDVALLLAERRAKVPAHHKLLAPTLLRSQVLAQLFDEVQRGHLQRKDADARLEYLRGLKIRLLGDRVLQRVAWNIAEELGWADTFVSEYLALTKLQADALMIRDAELIKVSAQDEPNCGMLAGTVNAWSVPWQDLDFWTKRLWSMPRAWRLGRKRSRTCEAPRQSCCLPC